jgi:hypothetical protein
MNLVDAHAKPAQQVMLAVVREHPAKLGDTDKLDGFRRLDRFVRVIEQQCTPEADFEAILAHECAISGQLDGRSVFDRPMKPRRNAVSSQLPLFDE